LSQGESSSSSSQSEEAPERIRVGEGVEAASLLHYVKPAYPADAKAAKITGTVRMHAIIGANGSVAQLEYISGPAELKDAAEDAVKQWRYKPILLNSLPAEVDTDITIVYTNKGAAKYPPKSQ
jgi:protein TonB